MPKIQASGVGAIGVAHSHYFSRAKGRNSCQSSCYNQSREGSCERIGEKYDYTHRPPPEYSITLVPEVEVDPNRQRSGEPSPPISQAVRNYFSDPHRLWNAVEFSEKRKDSQVARQIILPLPANPLIGPDDRRRLAEAFAKIYVNRGLVVQLDNHLPESLGEKDAWPNWHSHLLMPTRRLCREGLSRYKARDIDPVFRHTKSGGRVVECDYLGEMWRRIQDEYFRGQGLDLRVDPNGVIGQIHLGPVRLRKGGTAQLARAEAVRDAASQAARVPHLIAETLTRGNATFSADDVSRFLRKQLGNTLDESAMAEIQAQVLHPSVTLTLFDAATGEPSGRYTTYEVREQEESSMDAAAALAKRAGSRVSPRIARAVEKKFVLEGEQLDAFRYAVGRCEEKPGEPAGADIKTIRGRAGTGKSTVMKAIGAAWAASGKEVLMIGPTNQVIQDLKADGFTNVATAHAAIFRLKNGGKSWNKNTVVMVDETAMLDSEVMGEIYKQIENAGAKLIEAGDERQLGSIKRGGLFAQVAERHHSRLLTKVFRQTESWQQQASRDLAEYKFVDALRAFEYHKAIKWEPTRDEAIASLIREWTADHIKSPAERRFVFAYENQYVNQINDELHKVRRARGELMGSDVLFRVKRVNSKEGEQTRSARFAAGDRIQFTATNKALGIYNGAAAVIRSIDPSTGEIKAELDAPVSGLNGGDRRIVVWRAAEFNGFDLGYAGTIYKGQGKTFAQTYLLHTSRWQSGPSYVALTRHRREAKLFVGRDVAPNLESLAKQMSKEGVRDASIAWKTYASGVEVGALDTASIALRAVGDQKSKKISVALNPLQGVNADADAPRNEAVELTPSPHRDGSERKLVSAEARAEIEAIFARWGASRGGKTGVNMADPTLHVSGKDVEALRQLLSSLAISAESSAAQGNMGPDRLISPKQGSGDRKSLSADTQAEMGAVLARWRQSRSSSSRAAGPMLQLSDKDADALRNLLGSLEDGSRLGSALSDPRDQTAATVVEPQEDARAALERERRAGYSSEVR